MPLPTSSAMARSHPRQRREEKAAKSPIGDPLTFDPEFLLGQNYPSIPSVPHRSKPQEPEAPSLPTQSPAPAADRLRLLVPIGAGEISSAAVRYALRQEASGVAVQVCLLHVEEPPGQWELLRHARLNGRAVRERIEAALAQVAEPLEQRAIPYAGYLRAGGIVFAILDAAEELDCQRIVVPAPQTAWWRRLLSRDVVATLRERQRSVPVVTVSTDGEPAGV